LKGTVHGRIASAFAIFPAAPLLVLGLVALALALLGFAVLGRFSAAGNWPARLRSGGVAYLSFLVLVWAVSYGARLSEALGPGTPTTASSPPP
jgi:hypothetical protein